MVAKIRMILWMRKFNQLLSMNKIRTFLNIVYVDDQNWAGRMIEKGKRWDNSKKEIRWDIDWEREDMEENEENDKRTMRVLRDMGNSIERDIRMKEDFPSKNESGKLPMLDTQMWIERTENGDRQIRHELYEKPMVSRLVTMEQSSLPLKTKIQVLAQEVVRWRRNTYLG